MRETVCCIRAGLRHLFTAFVVTLFALALFAPHVALAADGDPVDRSGWIIFGFAINMIVTIVAGAYSGLSRRGNHLSDQRVTMLEASTDARFDRLSIKFAEVDKRLQATREDYAKKSDVDSLRTEVSALRKEVDNLGMKVDATQQALVALHGDVTTMLNLLRVPARPRG